MRFEEFIAEVDQAVRESCKAWGLPRDYRSALEGAEARPGTQPQRERRDLAAEVEALSDEQLKNEMNLARARITAVSGIAARTDGVRHGHREIHAEVSELVDRAFHAGQTYALLEAERSSRSRHREGGSS